jgi:membrane protease YdiL (CAAX protease family)
MSVSQENPETQEVVAKSPRAVSDKAELLLVLAFGCVPYLIDSWVMFLIPREAVYQGSLEDMFYTFSAALRVTVPLLAIIYLRRRWNQVGLVKFSQADIHWAALGVVLLFVISRVLYFLIERIAPNTPSHFNWYPFMLHRPWHHYVFVAVTSAIIGFQEELTMRGYLLTQWERVSRSTPQAVVFTSLIFGVCHIYQGWIAAIQITVIGIALSLLFVHVRRLWPVAIAHAIHDFVLLAPPS